MNHRFLTYKTWQEASAAAIRLGINSQRSYQENYRRDKMLPSEPRTFYKDFPRWKKFLNIGFYETWQEASFALINLGVNSRGSYDKRYVLDPKLPSNPQVIYKDFPGWKKYLCNEFYQTWIESRDAAIKLGVKNWDDYHNMRYKDRKLRSDPKNNYSDFVSSKGAFDLFSVTNFFVSYLNLPLLEIIEVEVPFEHKEILEFSVSY